MIFASLLFACSDSGGGSGDDVDAGEEADDPDSGGGDTDDVCGAFEIAFSPVVPTVGLVVDRSGSMKADYGGQTRWQALYDTLMGSSSGIVSQLAGEVRFGLMLYSGHDGVPDGTCPTLHEVAPAIGNYDPIDGVYGAMQPGEGTPTGEAVAAATPGIAAVTEPGPKLLILATDGLPDTCDTPTEDSSALSRAAVISAVQSAHDQSIATYVIGVGPDVASEHLQEVANAGAGLDPAGMTTAPYFRANDAQALVDAFRAIIDGARGCVFDLSAPVPDEAEGTVTLDGQPLDPGTDWQLVDSDTLALLGAACDEILSGGDHTVSATFLCPADEPDAGDGSGGVD